MSGKRSPASPDRNPPSSLNTNDQPSSPLASSPVSSPEKLISTNSSSPASPTNSQHDDRQVAPRPLNERGSLDDVAHLNGETVERTAFSDVPDGSATANGDSSPMELVDESLESEEFAEGDYMQDLRRVKVHTVHSPCLDRVPTCTDLFSFLPCLTPFLLPLSSTPFSMLLPSWKPQIHPVRARYTNLLVKTGKTLVRPSVPANTTTRFERPSS